MSNDRLALGRQIYDYFVGKGLAPHQAAAIAGNMAWEGGGRTDLVNPGDNWKNSPRSPHSAGIAQWNDRLPALLDYARQNGLDLPQGDLRDQRYVQHLAKAVPLQTQLDFAWNEMQGPEKRAYGQITAGNDLRSAVAGAIGYHRPAGWTRSNPYGGHGFDNRYALADQIMRSGDVPASIPTAGSTRMPAPYALGGPRAPVEPVSRSTLPPVGQTSNPAPAPSYGPSREPSKAPAWNPQELWDKQLREGHAEGGAVDPVREELAEYRQPELSSYDEPWYRALPNKVADWWYGPDANARQAEGVRTLLGPQNPLNLPGQVAEGTDMVKDGIRTGDYQRAALGGLEALGAVAGPFAATTRAVSRMAPSARATAAEITQAEKMAAAGRDRPLVGEASNDAAFDRLRQSMAAGDEGSRQTLADTITSKGGAEDAASGFSDHLLRNHPLEWLAYKIGPNGRLPAAVAGSAVATDALWNAGTMPWNWNEPGTVQHNMRNPPQTDEMRYPGGFPRIEKTEDQMRAEHANAPPHRDGKGPINGLFSGPDPRQWLERQPYDEWADVKRRYGADAVENPTSGRANYPRSAPPELRADGGSTYRQDYRNGGRVHTALKIAERLVQRKPSDAQKEAGNYRKGHVSVHGLDVTIENPKGSERSGTGKDGKRWSVKMPATYGYVKGTEGFDGDHVDVYLGPDHDSQKVFVIDQINAEDGKFDEHKCMLSYPSKEAALADYRKAFSDGKADDRIGAVTEMTVDRFKSWVKSEGTQVPLGDLPDGYADGGVVGSIDEELADYKQQMNDPLIAYRTKFAEPTGPQNPVTWESRQGLMPRAFTNPSERPADWAVTSGLAETLSPIAQGYGAGQMTGEAYQAMKSGDYGTMAGAGVMAAMGMMPMAGKGKVAAPRAIDPLGYYSGALEAAKGLQQAKGTPEQMLAMMGKSGAKAGEIEATGLGKFLEGRPSVTRGEIVGHLEQNRLGLNEVTYDSPNAPEWGSTNPPPPNSEAARLSSRFGDNGMNFTDADGNDITDVARSLAGRPVRENGLDVYTFADGSRMLTTDGAWDVAGGSSRGKWQNYSLDPSNPTYRETVLHLPRHAEKLDARRREIEAIGRDATPEQRAEWADIMNRIRPDNRDVESAQPFAGMPDFQSGHFPEPNIVGHMMTSMTKHEGKPVYTIDQIQSDWGQKLRDGGVRDEAKIARLEESEKAVRDEFTTAYVEGYKVARQLNPKWEGYGPDKTPLGDIQRQLAEGSLRDDLSPYQKSAAKNAIDRINAASPALNRIQAELATAKASTPGHPLVNTTDQWSNTTLRRAIRQAAEADADHIAIPTGDTVLSYNPGGTAGMHGFYGRGPRQEVNIGPDLETLPGNPSRAAMEGIVPKNLRKMLLNLDRDHPGGTYVDALETPSGMKGKGFTLFPLTPKIREAVTKGGLPLFSAAPVAAMVPFAGASDAEYER